MKFIADSMLGRLARWLRLLGHDTFYYPSIEDSLLLRLAREEQRTILTRDTRLVQVRGVKDFLLLRENDPLDQLRTVVQVFHLISADGRDYQAGVDFYSRCSLCNTLLHSVAKEDAKSCVPEYVYLTSSSFKKCAICDKYYWEGTHRKRLQEKLREILER